MTRVKKAFIDRESGERFQPGDTYPAATPERIAELQGSGHLNKTETSKEGEQNDDSGNASGGKPAKR
ncbi:hypothetical protein [uncultured Deinococcus sp.]|uniref:hypothetical protein n=1 Tax=uncultured Deinococcus sp. TaxID=158789 RepID=UPI0025F7B0AC|nr:hypothetical protein [uncultured Deinococcus sp.]